MFNVKICHNLTPSSQPQFETNFNEEIFCFHSRIKPH